MYACMRISIYQYICLHMCVRVRIYMNQSRDRLYRFALYAHSPPFTRDDLSRLPLRLVRRPILTLAKDTAAVAASACSLRWSGCPTSTRSASRTRTVRWWWWPSIQTTRRPTLPSRTGDSACTRRTACACTYMYLDRKIDR